MRKKRSSPREARHWLLFTRLGTQSLVAQMILTTMNMVMSVGEPGGSVGEEGACEGGSDREAESVCRLIWNPGTLMTRLVSLIW
jgi:hypothetical protein